MTFSRLSDRSSQPWTADLSHAVLAYLNARNVAFTAPSLQVCVPPHVPLCSGPQPRAR